MSSTNKTTYYQLSQYVGTDIINPLTDFNGDNEKIDTALHQIAETAGSSAADITALAGRVTTEEGKVTALENQNGNAVLVTTAQTLSGAINELKGVNDTQNSSINANTTSITNIAARVTANETKIDEIEETIERKTLATVTADGVKTNHDIMVELYTAIQNNPNLENTQLIIEVPNISYKGFFDIYMHQNDNIEYAGIINNSTSNIEISVIGVYSVRSCLISSSGITITLKNNDIVDANTVFKIVEK